MKWLVKTNIGELGPGQKFMTANIVEGETVEDVLNFYKEQWEEEDPIPDVHEFYIYAVPWKPTTYKGFNDPDTGEIGWTTF